MSEQIITQLLYDIVGVLSSVAAGLAIRLVLWAVKKYKMNVRNGIVSDALKYVEHKFGNVDGQAKFAIASKMISEQCAKFGVKIDEQTIEMLVDSGLKEFKLQFGEQWKSAVSGQGESKFNVENGTNEYMNAVKKATQMSV